MPGQHVTTPVPEAGVKHVPGVGQHSSVPMPVHVPGSPAVPDAVQRLVVFRTQAPVAVSHTSPVGHCASSVQGPHVFGA